MNLSAIGNRMLYCPECGKDIDAKIINKTAGRLSCARDGDLYIKKLDDEWVIVWFPKISPIEWRTIHSNADVLARQLRKALYCPSCAEELVHVLEDDEARHSCSTHGYFVARNINHMPTVVYIME